MDDCQVCGCTIVHDGRPTLVIELVDLGLDARMYEKKGFVLTGIQMDRISSREIPELSLIKAIRGRHFLGADLAVINSQSQRCSNSETLQEFHASNLIHSATRFLSFRFSSD